MSGQTNGSQVVSQYAAIPAAVAAVGAHIPPAVQLQAVSTPVIPDSWHRVDIAALFAAGLKTPDTTTLARVDGFNLFYPGRVHNLIGESGSLKTWVSLLGAHQEIKKGNRVLFLDYEDVPVSVISRMVDFGHTEQELVSQFLYFRPDEKMNSAAWEMLESLLALPGEPVVTLAILDGVTGMMTQLSLKVNDQEDVEEFYNKLPKRIARLGPAVVMIDHVTKSKDNQGTYAIGSQHKKAGTDGANYLVTLREPFAPGRHGIAFLNLAKDKNGTVQAKASDGIAGSVGTFHIVSDPATHRIEARIDLPGKNSGPASGFGKCTPAQLVLMTDYVKAHPGCSQAAVTDAVPGQLTEKIAGVNGLLDNGFLENRGAKQKRLHWVRDYDGIAPGLEDLG